MTTRGPIRSAQAGSSGGPTPLRAIIVDDHEVVRAGLIATLNADERFVVVGAAATGRAGFELVCRKTPDVVLVDLRLPDMTGEDLCEEIVQSSPGTAVVILSTYLGEEAVRGALRAGAAGYVTKAAGVTKLKQVLVEVGRRDVDQQARSAPQIVKELHDLVSRRELTIRATPQQERVVELAARGLTNRQVGEAMFISESTVRFHLQKLKDALGARTRSELVAKAIRSGLIPPAPEDLETVVGS